ncbi:hypothetical protein BUALT_Bualt10G0017000 [Buddleja alternifolia]|uniref:Uncharacterized protein n=1 Tax=Buddleja alternifolia TaxID=168488 RepID=A0AAV6X653_9LAMI|nr:hypothetical protein BUALT_Bualt10G0017000 [Buddleja alternifolia]
MDSDEGEDMESEEREETEEEEEEEDEEEEEEDRFASIIELCKPTASQEAKFCNCPLVRESENFADTNPDAFSSSPDPTPSEPTGIVMVSLPDSVKSVHQQVDDDAVFHTPPEHHLHSNLSSSEDQNLDELCAEGARTVGLGDVSDQLRKVKVSEWGLDDESRLKKIRVSGVELDGETVPVGETEVIVLTEENEGVNDTEVIDLDSVDSGEQTATINLAEDSGDAIGNDSVEFCKNDLEKQRIGELTKDGVLEVDATDENHELGKKCVPMVDEIVNIGGEEPYQNRDSNECLDGRKAEEEMIKFRRIVDNGCVEMRLETGVGRSEKVCKVTNDETESNDGYANEGLRIGRISIEEIDKFMSVPGGDVERRWKGKTNKTFDGAERRRQLPVTMKGKEKSVGGEGLVKTVETKSGLLDFLDVLKVVVGDMNGDSEDVDFLETAKKQGLIFPSPRWWPPDGDDE